MFDFIHRDWKPLFDSQESLLNQIAEQLEGTAFNPSPERVFRAFEVSPRDYRVLIVGQDPYPNPEHATGLAFCVPVGTSPLPPTLRNILTELNDDLGPGVVTDGDLSAWQYAGVMLMNRHLTCAPNQTASHFQIGWSGFTDAAIEFLQQLRGTKLVAILWGNRAQEVAPRLPLARLISSPHPSPLSAHRGFFGSKPFSGANQALLELGEKPIDWSC